MSDVLARTPLEDLRATLRFDLLHGVVRALPRAFRDADTDFFVRRVTGLDVTPSRRSECVELTLTAIPDAVGAAYVERQFTGDSRARARRMIESIQRAFTDRLPRVAWLDAAGRKWAQDKMDAMVLQIGYPDAPESYAGLELTDGALLENLRASARFVRGRQFSTVGKPFDRDTWIWDATRVNAANIISQNATTFPAAVLQPPLFSRGFPGSVNYGAIGTIMGHELTHGFDNVGRVHGLDGAPGDYWSNSVSERFEDRAACVQDQFSAYEALPGLNVDGMLTLGENIADLGGIRLSFEAYRSERDDTEALVPVDLTDDQLFFVSYGQLWCAKGTDAQTVYNIAADPHAPSEFRVNGPLSNLPEFARAFACKKGDPMVREDRCEMW